MAERKTPVRVDHGTVHDWEDSLWLDAQWGEGLFLLAKQAAAPEGIDPKWMALVALAVDAAPQSLYPQGMRRHMRAALALGATRQEIAAVLRYVSLLGQHSIKLGASILKEELAMSQPQLHRSKDLT